MTNRQQYQVLVRLRERGACADGVRWVETAFVDGLSLQEVWEACADPAWLAWMLWLLPLDPTSTYRARLKILTIALKDADLCLPRRGSLLANIADVRDHPEDVCEEAARLIRVQFPWKVVCHHIEGVLILSSEERERARIQRMDARDALQD